jgi:succinoglycan biosynthesis protein ExoM
MFRRCLDALLNQQISKSALDLRLLVVDNSVNAVERDTVRQLQIATLPVDYLHEPTPGIPNARNAALEAIDVQSADWIAFIDDDEIPPKDWIARLHAIAIHSQADVASGMLIQFATAEEAQQAADNWRPRDTLPAVTWRNTCATSNVIFRVWLINQPNSLRFDEGMRHGGSDTEFFMRAKMRGARIAHVRDVPVFEEYPPERQSFEYQCKRAFRVGATYNYRHRKNFGRLRGFSMILGRALYKVVESGTTALWAVAIFPFSPTSSALHMRRSIRRAVFAFGCVAPTFGITTSRYW